MERISGLIQMPRIFGPRPMSTQSSSELDIELAAQVADALMNDHHGPLGQNEFNVVQAEVEEVIRARGMADDLAWVAVAAIQGGLAGHGNSLARRAPTRPAAANLVSSVYGYGRPYKWHRGYPC